MKNKILAIVIFLIILVGVGFVLYKQSAKPAQAPSSGEEERRPQQAQQAPAKPAAEQPVATTSQPAAQKNEPAKIDLGNKQLQGTFSSGEGDITAPDIQVAEIDYDGSKFTPDSVNIKINDYVIFKNNGNNDFWPASNPHPVHTDYPAFDAKQAMAPGGKFTFQFTKAGNWGFHDHLNPAAKGTVNVSQ